MSVEDLLSIEGIDEELAKRLIKAGVANVTVLAMTSIAKLTNPDFGIGLDRQTARGIKDAAEERCNKLFGFVTGEELIQQYSTRQYLTTGIRTLDHILYDDRGLSTQLIYELYGPGGGGKADLLHQLVCTASLPPKRGGLGVGAVYIDTEGKFSLEKIREIAQRFRIDYERLKQKILRFAPGKTDVLLHFCKVQLVPRARERGIRLFCLDNLASLFHAEYDGWGKTTPERQQKLNQVIGALRRAAEQLNGIAIYTNQINMRGEPALGTATKHETNVRMLVDIKDAVKGLRVIKIEKALDLPPLETVVKLGPQGFRDLRKRVKRK